MRSLRLIYTIRGYPHPPSSPRRKDGSGKLRRRRQKDAGLCEETLLVEWQKGKMAGLKTKAR